MSSSTSAVAVEVDRWTKAGHENFKKMIRFNVEISPDSEPTVMTWDQWMRWQATRDPIKENPIEAERVRKNIEQERRGPGISRRVKKAPATKPTNATDKKGN